MRLYERITTLSFHIHCWNVLSNTILCKCISNETAEHYSNTKCRLHPAGSLSWVPFIWPLQSGSYVTNESVSPSQPSKSLYSNIQFLIKLWIIYHLLSRLYPLLLAASNSHIVCSACLDRKAYGECPDHNESVAFQIS